ncbi:hypothetical protein H6G76_20450 [Nostoc sp. FACHB-152]|uniref:GumC family protein n=1 Tax=unclassified Nostoc TaxID=2593658 RepID=UPI001686E335|nr:MULTISPECIES: hypothetical protein [unclassified Nostoc]MBD2449491.1 hypothetical protein [Nostoc sp. FACHB-152]MBD2470292.1 hypothetical protein [Nostoc sp. FACHB-145]
MSDFTVIRRSSSSLTKIVKNRKSYFLLWLLSNAIIWSLALLVLKKIPASYTSEWTIAFPGAKTSSNVNLPGIGQASTYSDSNFNTQSSDPRENYKFIALTDEVIKTAANQLNISIEDFGKPQIKILDNTTFMQFRLAGNTPQQAQQKAIVFQRVLEAKLEELRKVETSKENSSLEASLNNAGKKLQAAQRQLYEYKANSPLISSDQLRDLSVNVEGLRRQRSETLAQLKQVSTKFTQLSASLGLSAQDAVDALVLQSNPLFQRYLGDYSTTSGQLASLSAKYMPTHPAVITKQMEKDAANAALLKQAQSLLGRPVSQVAIEQLNINSGGSLGASSERAVFFQQLISLQTDQQGLQAQAQELAQQIKQLESRITYLSQKESQLDNLQRNTKIAEAVFSSTLTKLDLGKSNISVYYPQFVLLSPPNLPAESSSPKTLLVLFGAVVGSFFLTTGVGFLWFNNHKSQNKSTDIREL